MLPRYGKNYSIVSQLAPGSITLEILFQQNVFPAEKFNIQVPENGGRGFLLTKREEKNQAQGNYYVLYDLQKKIYLEPLDSAAEKSMNDATAVNKKTNTNSPADVTNTEQNTAEHPQQTPPPAANNNPHFIDSVELNNNRVLKSPDTTTVENDKINDAVTNNTLTKPDASHATPVTNNDESKGAVSEKEVINNDCPNAISSEKFENIYNTLLTKNDSEKLGFLLNNLDNCFSTGQERQLANKLIYEADKYVFVKAVYNKTTDSSNFYTLQDIFETDSGKKSFNLLLGR